ncbi:hypothetical protein ABEB36_010436 [Hypothenemus hampei]|uniref:Uncharacterized protein n=1 Tax=Hypothenemus hampei TaxID=57062 RepID=A0ABD1EK89_HYPHA
MFSSSNPQLVSAMLIGLKRFANCFGPIDMALTSCGLLLENTYCQIIERTSREKGRETAIDTPQQCCKNPISIQEFYNTASFNRDARHNLQLYDTFYEDYF